MAAAAEGALNTKTPSRQPSVNQTPSGGGGCGGTCVSVYLCFCQSAAADSPPICPPVHTSATNKHINSHYTCRQSELMKHSVFTGRQTWRLHTSSHTGNPPHWLIGLFWEDNGCLNDGFYNLFCRSLAYQLSFPHVHHHRYTIYPYTYIKLPYPLLRHVEYLPDWPVLF